VFLRELTESTDIPLLVAGNVKAVATIDQAPSTFIVLCFLSTPDYELVEKWLLVGDNCFSVSMLAKSCMVQEFATDRAMPRSAETVPS
jgi:hypothetical protein